MPEYVWMCLFKQDSEYVCGPKYAKIPSKAGFPLYELYTAFWIWQNMPWQWSECNFGSKHTRILNTAVLNIPGFWIWQRSEYARVKQGYKYATDWLNMF